MYKANIAFIIFFIILASTSLFFYIFYFNNDNHKLFQSYYSDRGIKLAKRNAPYIYDVYPNDLNKDPHKSSGSPKGCLTCHDIGGAEINGKIVKRVNHSIEKITNCMDCHEKR